MKTKWIETKKLILFLYFCFSFLANVFSTFSLSLTLDEDFDFVLRLLPLDTCLVRTKDVPANAETAARRHRIPDSFGLTKYWINLLKICVLKMWRWEKTSSKNILPKIYEIMEKIASVLLRQRMKVTFLRANESVFRSWRFNI